MKLKLKFLAYLALTPAIFAMASCAGASAALNSSITMLSATVCTDAGNASLGKMLQILGGAAVLSLSVPMFRALMTMIREMIGEL